MTSWILVIIIVSGNSLALVRYHTIIWTHSDLLSFMSEGHFMPFRMFDIIYMYS